MSFSRLSECLDDEYTQVLYVRACYSVHTGAMGDASLLGRHKNRGVRLYSGATYNGASAPLQLAVSSFANITETVFDNLGTESPVSTKEFITLLHTFFQNAADEMKAQQS